MDLSFKNTETLRMRPVELEPEILLDRGFVSAVLHSGLRGEFWQILDTVLYT